ncbi:MAG: GNAT family N-acetyltransferase [Solirubrobacterales bacterium]|nr:GNAT family N-acetyltransferase [Solirubrobacterales bacterium]
MSDRESNDIELHGERLVLRRARDEDAKAIGAILSDPEVVPWWGPFNPQDAFDELGSSYVIVVDGAVAGWLVFAEEDFWQYRFVSFDIVVAPALQHQGYGREALRVAIRHFIARGHHRFTIDPAVANKRAIRSYESVGFKPVGVMREYEQRDGEWRDGLLMDLLAGEFIDG